MVTEYFADPRLAGIYDALNPGRVDIEFYLALAAELRVRTVLDIGCGTGVLAESGCRVVGVDPSRSMLAVARARSTAVTWIHGTADDAAELGADLAVLTGHAAQVFLDDAAWAGLLRGAYRALAPGGRLAFESRDPAARGWERWNPQDSLRRVDCGPFGLVDAWSDATAVDGDVVTFDEHHRFLDTGEDVTFTNTIRFPGLDRLTGSLTDAGFEVEHVYGDWDRSPVTTSSAELIMVARR